ncbi:MAG: ABC transporter ATP-binding protein [Anaerolineae bacterium]|nr:ABC transporter ATP-binding protein [Anaerolineae bacterium]
MLRASELTKRYGSTLALDRLSLDVPAGAVFGLLGPNGSGKTTFLKLVMGLIFPEAGQIDRGDLSTARIGYLSEHAFYPTRFAVRDYLNTLGHLSAISSGREIDRLLAQLGLEEFAGRRLGALSRGTLQRVGLAQVLLGNPDLILLDEPVLGLDPAAQKFMRDQIVALHLAGKTVFLCSHNLDEVTRVCTHVAVLKQGKLVHAGPLHEMLGVRSQVIITTGSLPADLCPTLANLSPGIAVSDGRVTLNDEARAYKAQALRLLLDAGVDIQRLDERQASLEEIYLKVTGPARFPGSESL